MLVVVTMRSPKGASLPVMSKNQTVVLFSISRGFHALKLRTRNKFDNQTNGKSRRHPNPYSPCTTKLQCARLNRRGRVRYVYDPTGKRLAGRMRTMLWVAILFTVGVVAPNLRSVDGGRVTFKHPASASDLRNFYRSIQALSADSFLDGSAVAIA
jgi:hypothetical protein